MITLKSAREIRLMREAGRIVAHAHQIAQQMVAPGVTTGAIDQAIEAYFQQVGATPLFKGFPGKVPFPAVTCISVNEQVVHGIPGPYVLKPGDLVSVDTGCRLNGWCGDAAWTYPVGDISPLAKHLMEVGVESLKTAIEALAQCRDQRLRCGAPALRRTA